MTTPSVLLSPVSGSFPYPAKNVPLPSGTKIILGSTDKTSSEQLTRSPSTSNGWFAPIMTEDTAIESVSPLPLSSSHAEIWHESGQVYIRDLDSAFGTFVNGLRITSDATLRAGDIIALGSHIPRNDKTPAYITDLHLSPVIAKVSLSGFNS